LQQVSKAIFQQSASTGSCFFPSQTTFDFPILFIDPQFPVDSPKLKEELIPNATFGIVGCVDEKSPHSARAPAETPKMNDS
jgi:hypothetical protein